MKTGKRWVQGHIGKFWHTHEWKTFPYVKQPVTQEEVDDWVAMGYDYVKSYTGLMYDNRNPMPEWIEKFKDYEQFFNFKDFTFTFYKMNTLDIMPKHVDHFRTYIKRTGAKKESVHRILVMLEDWKPGHYLEIDGTGIIDWVAGDYFIWENDVPHAAANIGVDPRYTLQITVTKQEGTEVWRKLHWYNIPSLEEKPESRSNQFLQRILDLSFKNVTTPFYIYMYNNEIKELDDIDHDLKTVDHLNNVGLDIYLYEPLCSYVAGAPQYRPPIGTKHDRLFYSEFYGHEDENKLRADELNSILRYVDRNNLTNVTVHACDYNIEQYYPYVKDKMKLVGDDLYVKTMLPIHVKDTGFKGEFNKKFISANWRYAPHRHMIAALLATTQASHTSFYYKSEFSTLQTGKWYDMMRWHKDPDKEWAFFKMVYGVLCLNQTAPLNLDLKIKDAVLINDPYFIRMIDSGTIYEKNKEIIDGSNNSLEDFYSDSFCDVVTESRFAQPTANYSEKVFQPMWYKKPYVLVAPPHTLKVLKDEGFKTFNDFWDESYDDIEIHEDRLLKIFKVIDFINDKSIEELREMFDEMKPILQHNYDLVKEKLARN